MNYCVSKFLKEENIKLILLYSQKNEILLKILAKHQKIAEAMRAYNQKKFKDLQKLRFLQEEQ